MKHKREIIQIVVIIILQLLALWKLNAQTKANFENNKITYQTTVYLPEDTVKFESKIFSKLKTIVNTIPSKKDWTLEFNMEFLDKPDFCEVEYSNKKYTLYINGVEKAKSTNISAIRAYLLSEFYFIITGKKIYN